MKLKLRILPLASLLLTFYAPSVFGVTRVVNNVPFVPACNGAYATIQAAVNAANAGDTVYVCASATPYNEQVEITKTIILDGQTGALVQPGPMVANTASLSSGQPIAAAIWVHDTTGAVTVADLIVDGSNNGIGDCATDPIGIYYQNATGTIAYNAVRNFKLGTGLEGCQSGLGIFAQSSGPLHAVTAFSNTVHDFQKNGITGNGAGVTLTAQQNKVIGLGPTPNIAQNGIQIAFGATGAVGSNTVTNVVYTPCTDTINCSASSTGILIYQADGVNVNLNNVSTTQGGIYYFSAAGGNASSNTISNTLVYDGIAVADDGVVPGNNHVLDKNIISTSGESNVFIATNNNSVTNSTLSETPIGIWFSAGTGNSQSANKFYTTPIPVQNGAPPAAQGVPRQRSAAGMKPSPAR